MTKEQTLAKFLVANIVLKKITYLEAVTARPELKDEIDAYIAEQGLEIDKTK